MTLGIKLPFLVMHVKNLKKDFTSMKSRYGRHSCRHRQLPRLSVGTNKCALRVYGFVSLQSPDSCFFFPHCWKKNASNAGQTIIVIVRDGADDLPGGWGSQSDGVVNDTGGAQLPASLTHVC